LIKKIGAAALLVFISSRVFCDPASLQSYKQSFSRADLSLKSIILEDAARDKNLSKEIASLYEYALQFALDNSELLKFDPDMINMTAVAASGLRNTGHSASLDSLWKLFLQYPASTIGAEILVTIGNLGKGNKDVVNSINNYLAEQNALYRSGGSVNYEMISACIAALLELGDSSSYSPLFAVLCAGYPEIIAFEAYGAMELIPGNFKQFLFDAILKNPPEEKFAAFKAGINSERLSVSERGQLAELALEQALVSFNGVDDNADLSAMRYSAVLSLIQLRWTRANALAIRHYYRVQTDFQHYAVTKQRFIEAITLLGAVGNSDAALVLILQLGLINARTESIGSYDAEITQAIVKALGQIGDKAAFDQLLYVRTLMYPDSIHAAAKEAIDRLKW